MEREILFNGKRKRTANGEWVEGYYGWSMGRDYITHVHCVMPSYQDPGGEYFENTVEVTTDSVGQYTGVLATIDGLPSTEKIFENHIVQIDSALIGFDIEPQFRGVVKFIEGCWKVDNGKEAYDLWSEVYSWAILGNKFDNPELLDQKFPETLNNI